MPDRGPERASPHSHGLLKRWGRLGRETIAVSLLAIVLVSGLMSLIVDVGPLQYTFLAVSELFQPGVYLQLLVATANSAWVILASTVLLLAIGMPLGVATALHTESRLLAVVNRTVFLISSVPVLLWAILVVEAGLGVIRGNLNLLERVAFSPVVILPVVFGDGLLADLVNRVRLDTAALLKEPYMRTVRAAELGVQRELYRGIAPSVAELMVSRSLFLVSSAIVAEWIFIWPGVGYETLNRLSQTGGGKELILGLVAVMIVLGIVLRVGGAVVARAADPRRSFG